MYFKGNFKLIVFRWNCGKIEISLFHLEVYIKLCSGFVYIIAIVKDHYNRDVAFSMKANENELFTTARVIIVKILGTTHLLGLVE